MPGAIASIESYLNREKNRHIIYPGVNVHLVRVTDLANIGTVTYLIQLVLAI